MSRRGVQPASADPVAKILENPLEHLYSLNNTVTLYVF